MWWAASCADLRFFKGRDFSPMGRRGGEDFALGWSRLFFTFKERERYGCKDRDFGGGRREGGRGAVRELGEMVVEGIELVDGVGEVERALAAGNGEAGVLPAEMVVFRDLRCRVGVEVCRDLRCRSHRTSMEEEGVGRGGRGKVFG